ncbi:MAG TPA: hypothetical protein DCE56_41505 [Cyanobacteria bacterium UBA8553]|nr:hypothetical protein [Cyanobacteria bacterium UBA8553]
MSSLGQLVAGGGHEINNPINFVYGNLSHARQYIEDLLQLLHLYETHIPNSIPEVQAYLEEIEWEFLKDDLPHLLRSMEVGAERIMGIVRSLQVFSRVEQAEPKPVNLHEHIDSTLMLLSNRLQTKTYSANFRRPDIEVVKKYGELPLIEGHAEQLSQVFMNLLANAIDAINERVEEEKKGFSPKITICTEVTRDLKKVVIQIKDNGIGISDKVRQRIFEQFFTTKPVGQGTGLGLSISRQIVVAKHGGTLDVNSTLGEGSEFVITLPVKFESVG